jgi:hypothetical protein
MVEYWVGRLVGASWAKLGSSPRVPRGAHGDRLKLGSLDVVGCVRQAGVISWCIWVSISGLMPVERMIVLEGTGDVRPWACRQALRLRRICAASGLDRTAMAERGA